MQYAKIKNVAIAGNVESIKSLIEVIKKNITGEIRLTGFLLSEKCKSGSAVKDEITTRNIESFETITNLTKADEIIISEEGEDYSSIFELLEKNGGTDSKIHISPGKYGNIPNRLAGEECYGIPLVRVFTCRSRYSISRLKRTLDIFITFPISLMLMPLILLIAALIKLTSRGPVFYSSKRVGYKGKLFIMHKFRTMIESDNDDEERKQMMLDFMKNNKSGNNDTKIVNSCRITRIGKFLRKTSLDELPQLLNVLKGEMSLVGPRPCLFYEFENYEDWQKKRSNVIPGCTGLWQISGRSKVTFDESVFLDLLYMHSCSFIMDLKIIMRTLPVMILSHGGR